MKRLPPKSETSKPIDLPDEMQKLHSALCVSLGAIATLVFINTVGRGSGAASGAADAPSAGAILLALILVGYTLWLAKTYLLRPLLISMIYVRDIRVTAQIVASLASTALPWATGLMIGWVVLLLDFGPAVDLLTIVLMVWGWEQSKRMRSDAAMRAIARLMAPQPA